MTRLKVVKGADVTVIPLNYYPEDKNRSTTGGQSGPCQLGKGYTPFLTQKLPQRSTGALSQNHTFCTGGSRRKSLLFFLQHWTFWIAPYNDSTKIDQAIDAWTSMVHSCKYLPTLKKWLRWPLWDWKIPTKIGSGQGANYNNLRVPASWYDRSDMERSKSRAWGWSQIHGQALECLLKYKNLGHFWLGDGNGYSIWDLEGGGGMEKKMNAHLVTFERL